MQINIKTLMLENFKGIRKLEIDFDKITNIFGDNATGKTTIFDAFTWLLFDKDSKDRTVFEIKTLDSNNNVIHGLDHSVTGVLDVNGTNLVLSKTYREKWTKKRGESESQLTGHETLYYIDDVPVKKKEYQDKINDLIQEDVFKLITNPLYFSMNMKWENRRNTLLEIIGDISDDRVIGYKSGLKPLKDLLGSKDIEEFKKSLAARKKKLNDEIKSIPFRIDECHRSIKELDIGTLDFRRRGIVAGIKTLEEQLLDSSKVNEGVLKQKDKLYELKGKLRDIEYKAKIEAVKPLRILENTLRDLEYQKNSQVSELNYKEREVKRIQNQIEVQEGLRETFRKKWYEVNAKEFEFDESLGICPTCQRAYETDDVEKTRQEMQENFNKSKTEELSSITQRGKDVAVKIQELNSELESIEFEVLKTEIEEKEKQIWDTKKEIDEFVPSTNLDTNKEYQDIVNQIAELEEKLEQPAENIQIIDLKSQKRKLEAELQEVNQQLAYKNTNEELKERMQELQDRERELAQQIAQLEGHEHLCAEFTKTKVELLESSINNKFKYVSFKLFNTLVNGAIDPCCEALVDGVPFSNANTAAQINAGIDIINALCKHYQVSAPVFIDNRESVNEVIDCDSQLINLIVSKDTTLKVSKKEEVA